MSERIVFVCTLRCVGVCPRGDQSNRLIPRVANAALLGVALSLPLPLPDAIAAGERQSSNWLDMNVVNLARPYNPAFSPGLGAGGAPLRLERAEQTGHAGFKLSNGSFDELRLRYRWRTDEQYSTNQSLELLGRRQLLPGSNWAMTFGGAAWEPSSGKLHNRHIGLQVPVNYWLQTSASYRTTRYTSGEEYSVWPLDVRLGQPGRLNWTSGKIIGQGPESGTQRTRLEWPLSQRMMLLTGVERRPQANNAYNGQIGVQVRW